jgi:hypothetical protein
MTMTTKLTLSAFVLAIAVFTTTSLIATGGASANVLHRAAAVHANGIHIGPPFSHPVGATRGPRANRCHRPR